MGTNDREQLLINSEKIYEQQFGSNCDESKVEPDVESPSASSSPIPIIPSRARDKFKKSKVTDHAKLRRKMRIFFLVLIPIS